MIELIFSELQTKYCEKCAVLNNIPAEINHRAALTLKLSYKLLEDILKWEKKRNPDVSVGIS